MPKQVNERQFYLERIKRLKLESWAKGLFVRMILPSWSQWQVG